MTVQMFDGNKEKTIKKAKELLEKCIGEGKTRFVIYPYGEYGKLIENYLSDFGIFPIYKIDNSLFDGKEILNLKQAKLQNNDKNIVLICSDNIISYDEIRNLAKREFNADNILDLFPQKPIGYDVFNVRKSIYEDLEKKHVNNIKSRNSDFICRYFESKPIHCDKDELLCGTMQQPIGFVPVPASINEELNQLLCSGCKKDYSYIPDAVKMGLIVRNPGKHLVPGYDDLLQEGVAKRIECLEGYPEKQKMMKAFQKKILRYADSCKICEKIAYKKPDTFQEAVQLLLLSHEAVVDEIGSGSISLGRLDQYLYPFYSKDIEKGRITRETAFEIIKAFWSKLSEIPLSWQNITLGGMDQYGRDMCNELTLACLEATKLQKTDQPQVSLRVHKNMSDKVWSQAFDTIKTGKGFPELYNDSIAVQAKKNAGVLECDAWNYSIVGCVEISVGGAEYSHAEGMRVNLAKLLELLLHKGECHLTGGCYPLRETHKLEDIKSFDEFYVWYQKELKVLIERLCRFLVDVSDNYGKYYPTPFTSLFMRNCLETGKDVTEGGTCYNNLSINFVGMATVVDSLHVIEEFVYKRKVVSLPKLICILDENFEGHQKLRQELMSFEKYGNNIDAVDNKMKEIVKLICDELGKTSPGEHRNKMQAGFYSSYFHVQMGNLTGATPDGRKRGTPLSPSLSASSGMDINGPLALVQSASKIDMTKFGNGSVLDMKFLPSFFEDERNRDALKNLILVYFDKGGMEVQFNVIDSKTLRDAQINPERYLDLIVRVSGFSARFIDLEKKLQNEIICRTENKGI